MSRHVSPEQRYQAVLAVLSGDPVGEVARRNGVSRQTLYNWRRRFTAEGGAGLEDRSRRPHLSPARLDSSVEALICSLREQHPDWGAQRLRAALGQLGIGALPSRTTVHRVLVRNNLLAAPRRAGGRQREVPEETADAVAPGAPDERVPGTRCLTDLLGAARELVDRLDRALDVLAADPEPDLCPLGCGQCPPAPAPGLSPVQRPPVGMRVWSTSAISLFAQPAPELSRQLCDDTAHSSHDPWT